jgi:hypothetical protein
MRAIILALMAIIALSSIDTSPAEARDYPFCIKGREWQSPIGDCSFDTYQQCQATASGRFAWCDANPFYSYNQIPPQEGRRHHRRNVQQVY